MVGRRVKGQNLEREIETRLVPLRRWTAARVKGQNLEREIETSEQSLQGGQ
jgi:hypothetical protein